MPIGYGTNSGALASSFANASASSSKVTLESQADKPSLRNPTRNKLLPWSRRGRKSASAEYVKDSPSSDAGFQDTQIFAGRSLSSSPGGSEEALETHVETLIPTPWPCEGRPENCPSITSVPPYKHSTFYRLHAPTGPPYYINHHLRPPNQSAHAAAQSPVSAFSSSFPPLAAIPQGSPPLRTIRLGLAAPPDKQYSSFQVHQSSSDSVLPTPDSSTSIGFAGASSVSYQNRDELNAMSNLLAAADVDQLDVSSPWGQRFHHDSPYDLGQRKGKKPVRTMGGFGSVSATDLRARVPSNSRFSRPTTPSPLSQSTPAVNVQSENENILSPFRKLSKRKPSGLQAPPTTSPSLDSDSPFDSHRTNPSPVNYGAPESAVSMTTTAISQNALSQVTDSTVPGLSRKLSKRRPSQHQFPSTPGYISSPEKNKGTNVFSRMAKRISFGMGNFMSGGKRGMVFERRLGHKGSLSMTDVTVLSKERYNPPQDDSNLVIRDAPSQQELKKQGPRRVPPPPFEEAAPSVSAPTSQISIEPSTTQFTLETAPEFSPAPQLPEFLPDSTTFNILSQFQKTDIRDSLLSTDTEPEWSLGKLTIANPDLTGSSDTDTSLRGKHKKLTPLPRFQNRFSLMDPDPRASIRAEVDSRSSLHDSDVRFSRSFTSETVTPVQNLQSLQSPRLEPQERSVPPPPPKDRESAATSETVTAQDLRVSIMTEESSVTPTSTRLSSRVSSPELPPTPQDVSTSSNAPSDMFPPQPPSKTVEKPKIEVSIQGSQNGHSDASAVSSSSNNHSSAEIISPTKPRLSGRQEHVYIVDVPVDGRLFVRPSPDGTSLPPVEKPELPPLPPKPKTPENMDNPPLATTPSSVRQSKERKEKETTIFTSLFSTPRSRRTSETKEGSPHDRGSQGLSSRPSRRTRNSPDKSSPAAVAHSRSPTNTSTESRSRGECVKSERDHYASRRGDRRSYLEKRGDSDGDSGNKHRESRSYSQDEDRELRREQERRQAEHEERQAREKAKERERQHLREEEERAARGRREKREDEERRAKRAREREEEERRERKAREKEEEQRRLKRAREKEEEERRLRRAKEREAEERRTREDEERRLRRVKEKEEEERRLQKETERIEEEKKARREREEQERRIRKAKEEEERERERRERRRLEEERRLKKEEEERRLREGAKREEERRKRKEEEEEKRRREEESRRRVEEERKAKREEEERRRRKEEEERRRREEEGRRRREEEERRKRVEEERKARREEEERKLREQEESRKREEERRARKQQKEIERLEANRRAQEEAEWQERKAREEQQRREKERELIRQREMEIEQKHQEESSWVPETRSFYSMLSDRPITSTAGSSYFSNYASPYMGGHDWQPVDKPRAKKRSYDVHDSGRQAQSRREPARLPDINRRAELGIYSPESSSTFYRRPRAVSLESAPSQPPTPPYKDKGSSLRRQQTHANGHVHPSVSADETTFVRPRVPRPVSGIPSPGVFKASEAWEHDRFWRGQSMNFDSGSAVSGSLPPASWADHSYTYETSAPSVPYYPSVPHQGSSYTSYMVQPPAWSYPHYQHAAPIEPFSIPPSSNPLPPPPRQSNYQLESHSPP